MNKSDKVSILVKIEQQDEMLKKISEAQDALDKAYALIASINELEVSFTPIE